ncbi:MAG: AAA family ATPase [Prevotella sp.]|nr:AAA family ATPase [Prevotella sp.]
MEKLIGRQNELKELELCMTSNQSEFVVVYGRRRIGKTFLIRQFFKDTFTFYFTGTHNITKSQQLKNFVKTLRQYWPGTTFHEANDWFEAFNMLADAISKSQTKRKKVIFLDEMPWIDSPRSGFLPALEYFWNSWASVRDDIVFIACGSATSWIVNKLLHNHGGLFNRTTRQIYLRPFKLCEVESYLDAHNFEWDRYQITQCYMTLGGVPFYLSLLRREESLVQNIDRLFFSGVNSPLLVEYEELYSSLFHNKDKYLHIIKILSKKREGMTRNELMSQSGIKGETLTTILQDLERCEFIFCYTRYGNKSNNVIFRIKDFYSLFYYKYIDGYNSHDSNYWSHITNTNLVNSWQGLSFELVCMLHLEEIKHKLGIRTILTSSSTWRSSSQDSNAQIDLVIERADRIINLCEIKFSTDIYSIDANYERKLRERKSQFATETKTRKSAIITMITTFGIARNKHSGIVTSEVTMDDLFSPM